jgi:subtilisin family serine protease
MMCSDRAYSEEYVDYIIDYNGDRETVEKIYKDDCLIFIDDRYVILYRPKPDDFMESLSRLEYSLFPKIYGLMDTSSVEAVGAANVQRENVLGLTGKNVIVGIVDTGIDINNDLFKDISGKTRIISGWDMSVPGNSDMGFGTEYTEDEINDAISSGTKILNDNNGHGIFLSGIAAGNKTDDFTGVAPDASIIVVKLKEAKENIRSLYGIPSGVEAYAESDIMLGIAYLLKMSEKFQKSISILLGVGSNSGSHTGASALETYISNIGILKGIAVSVPGGNEGIAGHHFSGIVERNKSYEQMEINVTGNDSFSLEIWGAYPNTYSVAIEMPGGEFIGQISPRFDKSEKITPIFGGGIIYVDYFLVEDLSGQELIMLRFINPVNGIWRIRVYASGDTERSFNAWLPISEFISSETKFVKPSPYVTLTNPATSIFPMCVCAYNHYSEGLYINNSRGYTAVGYVKPDFVAPGVDVYGPGKAGTFVRRSGTSVAAAHCAGCAALMLQWASDRDFIRFINGNQIRNYFIRGAVRPGSEEVLPDTLTGDSSQVQYLREYPNREWGWGKLNIYNTFDSLRGR